MKNDVDAGRVIEQLLDQIRQLHLALALSEASVPVESVEQSADSDD